MGEQVGAAGSGVKTAWGTWGLVFLFGLPALSGHVQRLMKGGHWFHDYEAMACAGQRVLARGPIYDLNLACAGMQATPYVYPPITAQVFAGLERAVGVTATAGLYGALYWLAAAFMLSTTLCGVRVKAGLRERAPFLALISGSALFSGNVATLAHGTVGAAALLLTSHLWAVCLAIAVAAMIKPVFLTYVAILMFARLPLWKRAAAVAATVVAGLAPTAWFLVSDQALAETWRSLLTHFLVEAHGFSFFGWMSTLGIDIDNGLVIAAYLVFAAAILLAGLAIAEGQNLDPEARAWLGIVAAILLHPRLMSQDLLLLGPGMLAVTAAGAALSQRFAVLLPRLTTGLCILVLILTLAGGRTGQTIAILGFSGILLWVGACHVPRAKQAFTVLLEPYRSWLALR